MQWTMRCAQLSSLRPTTQSFIDGVHISLDRAQSRRSKPMRWITLTQNYTGLYEVLKIGREGLVLGGKMFEGKN